jgi:hypothetical protein
VNTGTPLGLHPDEVSGIAISIAQIIRSPR